MASRTEAKGRDAVDRIRQEVPQAKVRAEELDLASLRSVQSFAAKFGREAKFDLLINNAGVMSVPTRQVTEDSRLATRRPALPDGAFLGTSLLLLGAFLNWRALGLSSSHRLQGETHA